MVWKLELEAWVQISSHRQTLWIAVGKSPPPPPLLPLFPIRELEKAATYLTRLLWRWVTQVTIFPCSLGQHVIEISKSIVMEWLLWLCILAPNSLLWCVLFFNQALLPDENKWSRLLLVSFWLLLTSRALSLNPASATSSLGALRQATFSLHMLYRVVVRMTAR